MLYLSITLLYIISVTIFVVSADEQTTKSGRAIQGLLRRETVCPPGFGFCNVDMCAPLGAECCSNSDRYCPVGEVCVISTNGVIGCCPDGKVCEDDPPPPSPTTIEFTSTSTHTSTIEEFSTSTTRLASTSTIPFTQTTQVPTFTETTESSPSLPATLSSISLPPANPTTSSLEAPSITLNTASPTFYAPQSTPSAASGFQNVFIPGNTPEIVWSSEWTDSTSSCDDTKVCMKTSTLSSFTYMASASSSGGALYLDVSWQLTDFDIFINGQISNILSLNVETCEFSSIGNLPTTESSINITIVITGPATSGRRQSDFGSFEFNGFLIGQKAPPTSAASQGKQVGMIAATVPMALLAMIML